MAPGDDGDDLDETVYQELRRLAQHFLSSQPSGGALQTTEMVQEGWSRMRSVDPGIPGKRDEYIAIAGRAMRNFLVDYARARAVRRRGGE